MEREEQIFLVLTLLIGALVGPAVVAFIPVTDRFGTRLYPAGGSAGRRLLGSVVGSLGAGYLLSRFFPDATGNGVPQTKAALFARDGHISLRTVLERFFCTSATIVSGIPLGREGPSIQVGAGIASVLGRWLGLRPEKVKALVPVGAAAAIAAAFNTPLAAVLFTVQEVMGDLHAPALGPVVLASVTSWAMLRQIAADGAAERLLGELVDEHDPHLHADHPLHVALERFGTTHMEVLPVVSRADAHTLEGILTLPDLLHL